MATRSLPAHPNLHQVKLQAKELHGGYGAGNISAHARTAAHHPRWKSVTGGTRSDRPLSLAGAQLVIAREYGFPSWAALKHEIEAAARFKGLEPHPRFHAALDALDAGALDSLRALVTADPTLVHARTNLDPSHGYFAGATLLHHVAGNPWREQLLPPNIVDVARVLLEAGADPNAETLGRNGGTTMGLLVTGKQASDRGVTGPLMDLLMQHGARVDVTSPDVLDASLANHAPRAAEKLIELGAKPDVLAAAALGRLDLLRSMFDDDGRLRSRPRRKGKVMGERDAIGLALLYAYVREERAAVDFLLEKDGNWNMTGVNNGAVMHRAAYAGDLDLVQRLIAKGADLSNRDNPFYTTPLSWASHSCQRAVVDWMRTHCPIDLHEAIGHGFMEQVEARLRESPGSVNLALDHGDIPLGTPIHWAAWPHYWDESGTYTHDLAEREKLVAVLLDHGADPNVVAGNGFTALDIAIEGQAVNIVALLERRGAKRAADL